MSNKSHPFHAVATLAASEGMTNLQLKVAATISRDDNGAALAVNKGQLLRDLAPRSAAYKDITAGLDLLTGDAETVASESSKSFWGGLFGG